MTHEILAQQLPWLLSFLSLVMSVLTGNKWRHVWAFGLGIQCVWVVWIVAAQTYGFLPLCLALFVIYARNHIKWRTAEEIEKIEADTFDTWWEKNEADYLSSSYHMSGYHMARVVWYASRSPRIKLDLVK